MLRAPGLDDLVLSVVSPEGKGNGENAVTGLDALQNTLNLLSLLILGHTSFQLRVEEGGQSEERRRWGKGRWKRERREEGVRKRKREG